MEITDLTPAERRLWRAFPTGAVVDLRQAGDEPEHGGDWGPERTVRAKVLRALLLGVPAGEGEVAALRLSGARVTGTLDLQYATAEQAIRLWGCHFEKAPVLYGAKLRQLNLSESWLPGLTAATLQVGGVLRLTDCRVPGEIQLGGAKISGAVFLDRAHLGGDKTAALQLYQAVIGDDLWAPGLTVQGEVDLNGARVAGAITLDDATLDASAGTALKAESLTIGSNLSARRLRATGRVSLRGSTFPGQVDLTGARLSSPGGVALRASSCTAGELWLRDAAPIDGLVNLRRSTFELIHATPEVWPDRVRIDGLTYGSLAPALAAGERLELLERDDEGYVPHAYEQLAAAYRRIGDDAGARAVQLAKQRRHRRTLSWYAKAWGHVQDATVGYGFRPTRAMAWLVALLVAGTVVYGLHHPQAAEPAKGPDFHAAVYTLDLLLPIIDFGQEKAFNPHGAYQWLAYLLIAAGWVLATTVVAGVTRAVNRQ
ncbi:hypothetical protein [Actinomadura sp. DC4]|uniref:hypothetical protein n=1 Tax=Actinomadura sp. DC4 TaxID=3055069 RepID=UPI0025B1C38B|nr:hypothetical protein [Actinomadura sp. DC4]MDN3356014.1 hypothetical protein [Actinomadura sp. DC4]